MYVCMCVCMHGIACIYMPIYVFLLIGLDLVYTLFLAMFKIVYDHIFPIPIHLKGLNFWKQSWITNAS